MGLEAVQGIEQILLFRLLEEEATTTGAKLAFQTEHDLTETSESDSTPTKDGPVSSVGSSTTELSCTSVLARGDEMIKKLRNARRERSKIEIWEVDVKDKDKDDKYGATYFQGYVTEFSKTPAVDGAVEVSLSFAINGEGKEGRATLTKEQEEVVQYVFKDTVKATETP